MRHHRLATIAFLAAFATAPAAAQAVPDLSGHWVLDLGKSDFGPSPSGARSDRIEHREPRLSITRTIESPEGTVEATMTYAVDGKSHTNIFAGSQVTSTLTWDGRVLVMASVVHTAQGPADVNDRFSLSADGATLTIDRSVSVQGQSFPQTLVFTKR